MNNKVIRNDHGFTLIEIMVAIVLISLALIPFLGNLTGSFISLNKGKERTETTYLLQQKAEEIQAELKDNKFDQIIDISPTAISGTKWRYRQTVSVADPANDLTKEYMKKVCLEILDIKGNPVDSLTLLIYKERYG